MANHELSNLCSTTTPQVTEGHVLVKSSAASPSNNIETSQEPDELATDPENGSTAIAYPPADRGIKAWRLLLVAFMYETLLWGFPLSFGVFQAYYSRLPQFQDNKFISVIGTVASGISYLAAPVMIPIVSRYPQYRRHMILIGWPICLLGLVAGSFAETLATLIVTQGVMYGIGFIIFYYPILSMVNDYWITRRGMAYGFLCSATGVSGAAMPFAIQALLDQYGYHFTLRVMAISLAILTGPLIPFLKGRDTEGRASTRRTDWTFLRTGRFWMYSIANLAMSLAYFFPALYLPSYAISNGLSASQGALLLTVMSLSQVIGQISVGYLSDRSIPIDVLLVISTFVASIAAYTCWGLARTLPVMIVFSLIWGFAGNAFTALWGRIGTSLSNDSNTAFAAYGTFNIGKGLANVCAGVIGSALLNDKVVGNAYGALQYEKIILFTGTGMLASSVILLIYDLRHCKFALTRAW